MKFNIKFNMKFITKKIIKLILTCSIFTFTTAWAVDNHHFYRAPLWLDEPRYAKDYLKSATIYCSGGTTTSAFDNQGKKVPLLSLHGSENLKDLGVISPELTLPCANSFFSGNFNIFETQFEAYANLFYGFFIHAHLPIRVLELYNIALEPCSACCDKDSQFWRQTVHDLDKTLQAHNIDACPFKKWGAGDLSLLTGWTFSTYSPTYVDFFDATFQTGILIPTGQRRHPSNIFDIPLGYNGHTAIPLIIDCGTGLYDWLSFGAHFLGLFFFDRDQCIRPRTFDHECGFIRLSEPQPARIKSGSLYSFSLYAKADHCAQGFSFLLGYTYDHKNKDCIVSKLCGIDKTIANPDPLFDSWHSNILHIVLEYDWSNEDNPYGPRIGLQFNRILNGKNIFNTSMTTGSVGLDFEYDF